MCSIMDRDISSPAIWLTSSKRSLKTMAAIGALGTEMVLTLAQREREMKVESSARCQAILQSIRMCSGETI